MVNDVMTVNENRLSKYLFIISISTGIFSLLLGLIVLVGWNTGNKTLIQVLPVFAPMQFNTALGFALCGAGMILGILDNRYITFAIGILIICLGGLTLLEYISGLNIGIDELFMKHDIIVKTSQPGRMAPNTAACFILIGEILTFSFFSSKLIYQSQYKSVLASLTFGFSIVALSGYIIHFESAYGWGNLTRMAVHTSIGFIVLSLGILAFIWREELNNEIRFSRWLPIPIAIGALTITVCFWQVLHSEYSAITRQSTVSTGLSTLSMIVLIVGSLLSLALGLAAYLALAYIRGSREIARSNIILSEEIVEKEKAQEQVHRLSQAVEQSSSVVMITDIEGNIEYANPMFTQLTGYSLEEVAGKNLRILKSDKTPPEVYKDLWEAVTSGEEWHGEFCNRKKSGDLYWESVSISPVKNDKGAITNFIAVKDDITERKRSERRLDAQHEVTKILAESNTVKEASSKIIQVVCMALEWDLGEIWAFDQKKNVLYNTEIWHVPLLKFTEFKAATKQVNFSPQIGLPGRVWESAEPLWIADVVNDTNFPRASVAGKEGLHGAFGSPIIIGSEILGTICFYSREIRKPDEDLLDMMMAIGRQVGLFIKRKQAENALFQSDKLKSIGTITAGISHEFNNILAVISGNTQLLEMDYKDNNELMDVLRTISKAADDGAEISSKMLGFTRTSQDTEEYVSSDIVDLIRQSIDFAMPRWKNEAQAKGINYKMDTEGMKVVLPILCNPTEIREVFLNIINNALDAMPEGGSLSFSTWGGKDIVLVSISDTGEGMSEGVKKNVFDPFFTTKTPVGTGLGMSMAYGIITRHGGKIVVESEVGNGSSFTMQFPVTNKRVRPLATTEAEQKTNKRNLRILVVDDEKELCDILDKFLSRSGHKVKTVYNGADAINIITTEDFDLVLCDLAMPDVFGYDVIKAVNELEKRPKIGIITGWGEELKPIEGEGVKADFIIRKPFQRSELTKHINELFL